ncbi:MAG: tRNA (adenosine(37)-N6)-threonylcarbamoyltransferase complex ATPase subunit type 1 TsaE [Gemmatimonadaceae bacterium]|nr:tRNA (adenosine(37)-N6)-threonylcarbamoyltransferase complex ATPase subunit type 1 TsaE [Gemmatimonadaceae bacterium]
MHASATRSPTFARAVRRVPARGERLDLHLSRDALVHWGTEIGAGLVPGDVVTLRGDLGSGKTTLAQALCAGYGVAGEVTSPTYALVHEYNAPRSIVRHLDLYRLTSPDDLTNLGFDEMVGDGLLLIEWPERAGARVPAPSVAITLSHVAGEPDARRLSVER